MAHMVVTKSSNEIQSVFQDVSINLPSPAFKDKTTHTKSYKDDINSCLLSRLASTTNKYLMPTVNCPWGCSEFQHKVGYISLDILFQRYLMKYCFDSFTDKTLFLKVISVREDYIRDSCDEDCYFFNPDWKVLSSIAFITDQ